MLTLDFDFTWEVMKDHSLPYDHEWLDSDKDCECSPRHTYGDFCKLFEIFDNMRIQKVNVLGLLGWHSKVWLERWIMGFEVDFDSFDEPYKKPSDFEERSAGAKKGWCWWNVQPHVEAWDDYRWRQFRQIHNKSKL